MITSRMNGDNKTVNSLLPVQFLENININDFNQNEVLNVRLLCGADLLESFAVPGLWVDEDVSICYFITNIFLQIHKLIY